MGILVIIAGLLVSYFFGAVLSGYIANYSRRYLREAMRWLEGLFPGHMLWVVAALLIIPLAGVALLIFMSGWVFGVLGLFAVHVLCFLSCLSGELIRARFKTAQSPYAAEVGVFGVVFWYFFAGPLAMVLYYLVNQCLVVCAEEAHSASTRLAQVANLLDYVPVRLLLLTLALVGNFQSGLARWMQEMRQVARPAESIMHAWGQGIGARGGDAPDNEAIAVRFERVGWLWLVLLLMISLSLLLG